MLTCEQPKGRDGLGKKVAPLTFFVVGGPPTVAGRPAHSHRFNRGEPFGYHGHAHRGKPKPGLCAIYPTTNLVHCPKRMDMIVINNYFLAGELQVDHSNLPFEWHTVQAQWWDDVGILPSLLTVPPFHRILDITLPTLHRMKGLSCYRGIADPPAPLHYGRAPLARRTPTGPPFACHRQPLRGAASNYLWYFWHEGCGVGCQWQVRGGRYPHFFPNDP